MRKQSLAIFSLLLAAAMIADPGSNDWPMSGHDVSGNRVNPAETTLSRTSVGALRIKWQFSTPGAVYGTPAVVDGRVYDADITGNVYALDATSGTLVWVISL